METGVSAGAVNNTFHDESREVATEVSVSHVVERVVETGVRLAGGSVTENETAAPSTIVMAPSAVVPETTSMATPMFVLSEPPEVPTVTMCAPAPDGTGRVADSVP